MEYKLVLERRVMLGLALLTVTSAILVAIFNPDLVRFWPFTVTDFVQLMTPLFFVALFIERVLEVFLTSWRAESATKLKLKAEAASKKRNGADSAVGQMRCISWFRCSPTSWRVRRSGRRGGGRGSELTL